MKKKGQDVYELETARITDYSFANKIAASVTFFYGKDRIELDAEPEVIADAARRIVEGRKTCVPIVEMRGIESVVVRIDDIDKEKVNE